MLMNGWLEERGERSPDLLQQDAVTARNPNPS
jgi:hypothetical protein